LPELLSQLSNRQIAELILKVSKSSTTGEKQMWGWVKSLFRSPINYKIDLESVYQMAGIV
jgi:hypothetical protein